MDGLLNEKMKELLANPDAMARVMDMAGKLFSGEGDGGADLLSGIAKASGGAPSPAPSIPPPPKIVEGSHDLNRKGNDEDRIRLIHALCPYLNPSRREAAQALIRILKLVSMADAAGLWKRGD